MSARSRAGGVGRAGTRQRPRPLPRLRLLALATLALFAVPALAAQVEDEVETRTFSIPDTRAAAALAERAAGHLAAQRWAEALGDLQELLEQHAGALLGPERPLRSQQPVHPGVEPWVQRQLLGLPEAAKALYRQRHEHHARAALEAARATGDLSALLTIPRRWPITEAAAHAWWTIGDLELERGHRDEARLAWGRALAAGEGRLALSLAPGGSGWQLVEERAAAGEPLSEGLARRLELVRPDAEPLATPEPPRRTELRLPGPGEGARGTPGEEASTWPRPYALPDHPWSYSPVSLFPTRAGDKLLVSTSLGLSCVNAFSGTERWRSDEPPGWERLSPSQRSEFFDGLDRYDGLVAAAASDSIAVAALQIPVSQHENAHFNSIPILVIIPDRRLFAFDLDTGRELWNHMPPPGWDGEAGGFAQRMRVAGPPVVRAGRVLVPVYRMQGRVDLHLACYELATGALIWSTQLVSGQRELNMFNRHEWEYAAPPVRIEDDRVLVLTQLGTLAAVDFFSGAVLWETLYDQNPLPERRNHTAERRQQTWRNAAPVVADGVVVATPVDSDDLIGVDLETGSMLWSLRQRMVSGYAEGRGTDIDLLLGADDKRVYLAGSRLLALFAPNGLRFEPPVQVLWRLSDDELRQDAGYARPVLAADRIVVPTRTARLEIDRYQGTRLRHPIPWGEGGGGNLLLGDGMLFTLDANSLNGHFEWSLLLARAREAHEEAPADPRPALELAALLAERGRSEREDGRTDRAREWLDEARTVLAPYLGEDARDAPPEVVLRMHEVLRARARVLADLADTPGALEALRSARALAPSREAARDCLLEESTLLRGRASAERAALLEELDLVAGDLFLRCQNVAYEAAPRAERGYLSDEPPVYANAGGNRRRLAPLVDPGVPTELGVVELPVGLWVALERADLAADSGDAAAELAELHRVLELWPDEPLPGGDARRIAGLRIGDALERHGRGPYAPFERAAGEELARAREAQDRGALQQLVERFPHSQAARAASDLLLERALAEGEVGDASRIVLGELSEAYSPRAATARELELLLRLADALEAAGNQAYARALLRALAAARPHEVSPLAEHAGRTLGELAAALPDEPPPPEPPARTFDGSGLLAVKVPGRHTPLGAIPPAGLGPAAPGEVQLFVREVRPQASPTRRVSLVAYGSDDPTRELWVEELSPSQTRVSWSRCVAFAPGLALVATQRELIAFERAPEQRGGLPSRAWTWPSFEGELDSVAVDSGVALVVVRGGGTPYWLHALDLATGEELWRTEVRAREFGFSPVVGSGKLAVLPGRADQRALVFDLFTGRRTLEIELPPLRLEDSQAAWIEGGRLIVPWFLQSRDPDRNQIVALDLETGELAWRVSFQEIEGQQYLLSSILSWAGQTFLVLTRPPGFQDEGPARRIRDLKTPFGATGRTCDLGDEQHLLGVESKSRVQLDAPLVFVRSPAEGDLALRVHAIQLPFGTQRWVQRLSIPRQEVYPTVMPAPAVGDTCVALAITRSGEPAGYQTELHCFDRLGGSPDGNQILESSLGRSQSLSLLPLGDALLVAGPQEMQVMR